MYDKKIYKTYFTCPALFFYILLYMIPVVLGSYYSFTNWNAIRMTGETAKFIGLENYVEIFKNPQLLQVIARTILFAGETMPTPYLNYWQAHYPGALFANLFGPTETTDICAYYIVDRAFSDDEPLPIGRACDNCGLLVLTDDGRAAEHGAVGELCVRGSFLAAGYYNMPDKTAERFCPNPLQPHYPEIIYRTGDLVRYDENGLLQYMGRADNQIKHMGYRIELGEIETAAFGQEGLQSCACIYDAPKDRLVLFFTGRKGLEEDLRVRLAGRLPAYMQPTAYRRLQAMPQNQNGKIDRAALRALCKED